MTIMQQNLNIRLVNDIAIKCWLASHLFWMERHLQIEGMQQQEGLENARLSDSEYGLLCIAMPSNNNSEKEWYVSAERCEWSIS